MSATLDIAEIRRAGVQATDAALERLLPAGGVAPSSIHKAMRHSVFAGGKRLRPILAIGGARTIWAVCGFWGLPEGFGVLGAGGAKPCY